LKVIFGKGRKMKTTYKTTLMLAAAVVILLSVVPCQARQQGERGKRDIDIWSDAPGRGHGRMEMREEMVERMMERIAETDPERAKELERLRQENPKQFAREIRKLVRKRVGRKGREEGRKRTVRGRDKPGQKFGPGGPGAFDPMGERFGRGQGRQRLRQGHNEYIKWLEKNYPEEAETLAELRKKPELYGRRLKVSMRRYGPIMKASERNPKLAEVLKEDLELKLKREQLIKQLRAATDEAAREKLTKELKETVSQRFELIVKKKQLRYEELQKELEKLKADIKRGEAELEKLRDKKDEHIKKRLGELLSKTERFKWD